MLQHVYISTARGPADLAAILRVSQRNNLKDGITGLLFTDGKRFLQALEGEPTKIEATLARIAADDRHRAIVTLSRRVIAKREFGHWAMAARTSAEDASAFLARVGALVSGATPAIRATFESMAGFRRAA